MGAVSKRMRKWTARLLWATVFGMWGVAISDHSALPIALVPAVHDADHRDGTGGPVGNDAGETLAFTELEDSDGDSAHHALELVFLGPDASAEHVQCHGELRQRPAHEPPTPPPRA